MNVWMHALQECLKKLYKCSAKVIAFLLKFQQYLITESNYASQVIAEHVLKITELTQNQKVLLRVYLTSNNQLLKYFILRWIDQYKQLQQNKQDVQLYIDTLIDITYTIVKKIQSQCVWVYEYMQPFIKDNKVLFNYFDQMPLLSEIVNEYQEFVLSNLKDYNFIYYPTKYQLQIAFESSSWDENTIVIQYDNLSNESNLISLIYNNRVLSIKNCIQEKEVNNILCQNLNDSIQKHQIHVTSQLLTLQLINIECVDFSQCEFLEKVHLNKVSGFDVEYIQGKNELQSCVFFAVNEVDDDYLGNKLLEALMNAQKIKIIDLQHLKFRTENIYQLCLRTPQLKCFRILNNKNLHTVSIQQNNIQLGSLEILELDAKIIKTFDLEMQKLQIVKASNCQNIRQFKEISFENDLKQIATISDTILKFQLLTIKYCETQLFKCTHVNLQQYLLKQLTIKYNQEQRVDIQYILSKLITYVCILPYNVYVQLIAFICQEQIDELQIIDINDLQYYQIQTEYDPVGKLIENLAIYIVFHMNTSQCYTLFDLKIKFLVSLVSNVKIFENGVQNKYMYNQQDKPNTKIIMQWLHYLMLNNNDTVLLSPQFYYHDTFNQEIQQPLYMEGYHVVIEEINDTITEYVQSISEEYYSNVQEFEKIFTDTKLCFNTFISSLSKLLEQNNFLATQNMLQLLDGEITQSNIIINQIQDKPNLTYYIYGSEGSVCSVRADEPNTVDELSSSSLIVHSYSLNQRVGRIGVQIELPNAICIGITNVSLSLCHCPSLQEFRNIQKLAMFKVVGINVQEIKQLHNLTHFYGHSLKIDADFQKTFNSNNVGHLAIEILHSCLQIRVLYFKMCQMNARLIIDISANNYNVMRQLKELHLIENLGLEYVYIHDKILNDPNVQQRVKEDKKVNLQLLNIQPHISVREIHCMIDNNIVANNLIYVQGDSTYRGFSIDI